jgi:hypothetical protein
VGETEDFLGRSITHLRAARWKDQIHSIELEPMPKTLAKKLEPKIIATELPLYNTAHHPKNEVRAKARLEAERLEWQASLEQQIAAIEAKSKLALQAAVEKEAARLALLKKWRADRSKRDLALAMRRRRAPWDGRLETYRSIYDAGRPA